MTVNKDEDDLEDPVRTELISYCKKMYLKRYFVLHFLLHTIFIYKISFMKKHLLKKITGLSLPVLLFITLASFIYKNAETKTVTGEILDMECYMSSGAHGADHKECAASCISRGEPVGILADDGKVYLLIKGKDAAVFAAAKKLAGEMATVTGTLSEKGGVQALIVSEVKAKSK